MPSKDEFHTTINIRRPLGVPMEKTREQSEDNFKYDLWNLINIYEKELELSASTDKDPTNFGGKNQLYTNIIDNMDNMAMKNVFLSLWGYYFCTQNILGKNLCTCSDDDIKEIYKKQKDSIYKILKKFSLENKPKTINMTDYLHKLEIALIKYIEYFRIHKRKLKE